MSPTTPPRPTTIPSGQRTTPFGAIESPTILETIKGRTQVYRVDLLVALKKIWGNWITEHRNLLYKVVSGSCTDTELRQGLKFFYLRSTSFGNCVNQAYYFGDQTIPLLVRVVRPAREAIQNYYESMVRLTYSTGGEIIGLDKDYLYIQLREGGIMEVEGGEHIC